MDWAGTSHRPYYATMGQLAKPVHSRGDGLSSPCFAGRFIAIFPFPEKVESALSTGLHILAS